MSYKSVKENKDIIHRLNIEIARQRRLIASYRLYENQGALKVITDTHEIKEKMKSLNVMIENILDTLNIIQTTIKNANHSQQIKELSALKTNSMVKKFDILKM